MDVVGYLNLVEGRIVANLAVAWDAEVAEGNLITFRDPLPGSPEKTAHSDADFPEFVVRFKGMTDTPVMRPESMTLGDMSGEPGCGGTMRLRMNWEAKGKTRGPYTKELDALLMKAVAQFISQGPTMGNTPGVMQTYVGCNNRLINVNDGTAEVPDEPGVERFELTVTVGVDCELQFSELQTFNPDAPDNPDE